MIFNTFFQKHEEDSRFVEEVFLLLEEIICVCLMDYKDHLNSAFVSGSRRFLHLPCSEFLQTNAHLVKGYCFLKVPYFVMLSGHRGLNLDFSKVFFKLEYYLSVSYVDYYLIARIYIRNKYCIRLISKRKGAFLNKILQKAILSDKISQTGYYNRIKMNKKSCENLTANIEQFERSQIIFPHSGRTDPAHLQQK